MKPEINEGRGNNREKEFYKFFYLALEVFGPNTRVCLTTISMDVSKRCLQQWQGH